MRWIHKDSYLKMWVLVLVVIVGTGIMVGLGRKSSGEISDQEGTTNTSAEEQDVLSGEDLRFAVPRGLAYFIPWDGYPCVTTSGLEYTLVQGIAFLHAYRLPLPDLPKTLNLQASQLPPSPVPDHPVPPSKIRRGNPDRARVAITLDTSGGKESPAGKLINILIQEQIPATLFVCGGWAYANPEYLTKATEAGFEIASHSYTHPYMTKIGSEDVMRELTATSSAVQEVSGKAIAAYFRPPYGDVNQALVDMVASWGYYTIMWTKDTRDWDVATTPETFIRRATEGVQNGDIILMHMNGIHTPALLPQVAYSLRSQGFELTTVTGVLEQ